MNLKTRIERIESEIAPDTYPRCPCCDGIIGGVAILSVTNENDEPLDEALCPECGGECAANGCATHFRVAADSGAHVKRYIITGAKDRELVSRVAHWKNDPRWITTKRPLTTKGN